MRVVDTLSVDVAERRSVIELCVGDLTALPAEHATDLLVVSAFPDDYLPTPSSLIGALARKGVSVAQLATDKDVDLRRAFSCWLSPQLINTPPGIPYKRILCFEPVYRGQPPRVVGDIFRALAPFLAGPPTLRTVAMPVVAAGDQRYSVAEMLDPLLEAAVTWMQAGMPLSVLKIVIHSEHQVLEARRVFTDHKVKHTSAKALGPKASDFDVFISYAHEDIEPVELLVSYLSAQSISLFLDRLELSEGAAWQHRIFSAIDRCKRLVAFYSPAYVQSKVCQEEFNIAWARGRKLGADLIFPIYWCSADMPTYMTMLLYADCRERQGRNLREVATRLVNACAG